MADQKPWQYDSIEGIINMIDTFNWWSYVALLLTVVSLILWYRSFVGKPYPKNATYVEMREQEYAEEGPTIFWGFVTIMCLVATILLGHYDLNNAAESAAYFFLYVSTSSQLSPTDTSTVIGTSLVS